MKRIAGLLVGPILVLGLSAGSVAAVSASRGVVTGKADPCAGSQYVPITHLTVFREKALVTSRQCQSGSTFRIPLQPGRETITDNGADISGSRFTVRAAHTTRVVIIDNCDSVADAVLHWAATKGVP